jgi:hypothetical protein
MTRCLSIHCTATGDDTVGLATAAEASLPATVITQRADKLQLAKIGPQHGGEVQFRVGEIPQQEVADAGIAAGADAQIRFRQVAESQDLANSSGVISSGDRLPCAQRSASARAAAAISQRPP